MSVFGLLTGRGAEGLPPAEPIDFARLVLPPSPNTWLMAPAGWVAGQHATTPPLAVPPATAWAALRALGDGEPRCWKLAEWPDRQQVQWVVRTRLANFPDIVAGQIVALPEGAGLILYSRSLIGWSDFGVNRRRLEAWQAALDQALRRR